ncbi:MAG: hypothetical protein ACYCQI_00165 [Gammaproteobacteria bacterium]
MLRILGLILICTLLSACSVFNLNNNKNDDRIARCNQIKHQMVFNGATNDQLIEGGGPTPDQLAGTRQMVQMDSLERDYRALGCS